LEQLQIREFNVQLSLCFHQGSFLKDLLIFLGSVIIFPTGEIISNHQRPHSFFVSYNSI